MKSIKKMIGRSSFEFYKRKAPILPRLEARGSEPSKINPGDLGADPDASRSTHDDPTLSVSNHGCEVFPNVDKVTKSVNFIFAFSIILHRVCRRRGAAV